MEIRGVSSYGTRRFWNRVADIREKETDYAVHRHFHDQQAQAIDRAVAEIIGAACSPWFDERAFQ